MVWLYTEKAGKSLKFTSVVAYPVHVVLLKFPHEFWRRLIDHVYRFAELLLVPSYRTLIRKIQSKYGTKFLKISFPMWTGAMFGLLVWKEPHGS